jgi:hypothetical protein
VSDMIRSPDCASLHPGYNGSEGIKY